MGIAIIFSMRKGYDFSKLKGPPFWLGHPYREASLTGVVKNFPQ
jgi:hypothetical protein